MTESCCFLFVKQKTAYEMRISDWSSDVCSSDLAQDTGSAAPEVCLRGEQAGDRPDGRDRPDLGRRVCPAGGGGGDHLADPGRARRRGAGARAVRAGGLQPAAVAAAAGLGLRARREERQRVVVGKRGSVGVKTGGGR